MKWGKDTLLGQAFMSASNNPRAANVLLGVPMDFSASYRPGARFGPGAIRRASANLEDYSLQLQKSLEEIEFFDAGDLLLPYGNIPRSLDLIEQAVDKLLTAGQRPFIIGGDHLVTLPCLRAAVRHFPGLKLIHIDAHADLRDEYCGEELSHATVIGAAIKSLPLGGVWQFAVRSATREEHKFAKENTRFFPFQLLEPLQEVISELTGPIYITLDIDAVDPAFAPGTGTPESGGINSQELIAAMILLSRCQVVGFDLMEVAPAYDNSAITAVLAAKIIRGALLLFGKQP